MNTPGAFEAHLTVEARGPEEQARFVAFCAARGRKTVLIELSHGSAPTQPMTAHWHRGGWEQVRAEVDADVAALREAGFALTRVKIEALASNAEVPASDEEALREPAGRYFEFHVKVRLPRGHDTGPLASLAEAHGARLSRNAFSSHADGTLERFVTQRAYGAGRAGAFERFERLLGALRAAGYALSNTLREYTVVDTHAGLDAGWLDP